MSTICRPAILQERWEARTCRGGEWRYILIAGLLSVGLTVSIMAAASVCHHFRPCCGMHGASDEWHFGGWAVKVGDQVALDDTVALLKSGDGREMAVQASKGGTIVQIRDHLREGDIVDRSVEDLVSIGKFSVPGVGFMERVVEVPSTDAVFQYFLVKEGDWVGSGDAIAQVVLLTESESWPREELLRIRAPSSGQVVWTMPLRPGRISEQTAGVAIAKLRVGDFWWPVLLCALLTSCYLMFHVRKLMGKFTPKDAPRGQMRPLLQPPPPLPPPPPPPCRYLCITEDQCRPEPQPRCSLRVLPHIVDEDPEPIPCDLGLRLDFVDEGKTKTVIAFYKPLGIRHQKRMPITVEGFTVNSYAKTGLGVQRGWTLVRIANEEIGSNFQDCSEMLDRHMRDLPVWPLPVEFYREGQAAVVLYFSSWPIGLEFRNEIPITVDTVHPGGAAERLGVQKGWVIGRFGDYEVRPGGKFEEAQTNFKKAVRGLEPYGGALDTLSV